MNKIELKKLYDAVSAKYDIHSWDEFLLKMQSVEQRKRFYDAVSAKNFDLGDYNEYENRLSQTWTEPIVIWAINLGQKYKLSPTGNNFSLYNSTGNIWNFGKDGSASLQFADGKPTITGNWKTDGDGFVINYADGLTYHSKTDDYTKTSQDVTTNLDATTTNPKPDDTITKKNVQIGDKGDEVKKVQNLLIKHGYTNVSADGNIDGVFGPRTKQSVIKFQADNNLAKDGIVGPNTWDALEKGEPKGITVKKLQENNISKIVYENLNSLLN